MKKAITKEMRIFLLFTIPTYLLFMLMFSLPIKRLVEPITFPALAYIAYNNGQIDGIQKETPLLSVVLLATLKMILFTIAPYLIFIAIRLIIQKLRVLMAKNQNAKAWDEKKYYKRVNIAILVCGFIITYGITIYTSNSYRIKREISKMTREEKINLLNELNAKKAKYENYQKIKAQVAKMTPEEKTQRLKELEAKKSSANTTTAQDVHTNANGWNWLEYTPQSKQACVVLIFDSLGTNRKKYKESDMVEKLDTFYYSNSKKADAKNYLKIPCAVVIGEATGCEIKIAKP